MNRIDKLIFKKESYLHLFSCKILAEWISLYSEFFNVNSLNRIDLEYQFCSNGKIIFIPDVTVFQIDKISLFEVVHTSDLNAEKLNNIQRYFYNSNTVFELYTISANQIIKSVGFNKNLGMIRYN